MTARDPDEGEPRDSGESKSSLPPEEEAAWAAIVAAYGDEPAEPSAADGPSEVRSPDLDGDDDGDRDGEGAGEPDGDMLTKPRPAPDAQPPVRSFTVYAAGTGPRDWEPAEDEDGEGHFEPPEPPPLPETDTTTKFAWLAALGGPLLLLGTVLLQADMTWWIVTLGVGGFLGGFATLLTRLRDGRDDDDWDDPGRGAVV
ncbi:hypothetical protein [Streptomyces spirodelae]|uniref:DUF308 domain-containing protein n=1 Tax=Streptomyces spirodelae TaxID=2812904 RepID=A0ABS3WSG7_9ACTN|nr:hypothetical protein [Streptomyces spirodelae]MBO8186044.1 hypothetical protein [Streptomyces spirodelae]